MNAPAVHPLFGTGPEWRVTNYFATVEFDRADGVCACIPKPYGPQTAEWWRERATVAIANAIKAGPQRRLYA